MKPIQPGQILIADPYLQDGEFTRSVILMTHYAPDNTMGFILNHPSTVYVNEVFVDFPDFDGLVHIGGPVDQNMMFFVHRLGEIIPDAIPIRKGLYFGGDFEILKTQIAAGRVKKNDIRFYLGYSGWGMDQLHGEIEKGFWIQGQYKLKYQFTNKADLVWGSALGKNKPEYKFFANYSFTPSLN